MQSTFFPSDSDSMKNQTNMNLTVMSPSRKYHRQLNEKDRNTCGAY